MSEVLMSEGASAVSHPTGPSVRPFVTFPTGMVPA